MDVFNFPSKKIIYALTSTALVGCPLAKQKVAVGFPIRAQIWVTGSSLYKRQPIDISFSHLCFSPFLSPSAPSLKINK